jgi:hypothetical protein
MTSVGVTQTDPTTQTIEDGEPTDPLTGLAGCEMHVIGIYSPGAPGVPGNDDDRVFVEVKSTGKPMVVVMTSYSSAQWHLKIAPGADVRQIILAGYYSQEVSDDFPKLPTKVLTYFSARQEKRRILPKYFYAYAWHTAEGRKMRVELKKLTGLDVTTFQGVYQGTEFTIDGKKGDISTLETRFSTPSNRFKPGADEESKKLKLLENQLREVVTQAFNAQVQLQRVRLQLAALELGELQIQQEKRMSLAEQIVARRVADLLSQDSLEWSELVDLSPPDATSLPTAPRR